MTVSAAYVNPYRYSREVGKPARQPGWCWTVLDIPGDTATKTAIEDAYRRKAKKAHPDKGGSDWAMAELNEAKSDALRTIRLRGQPA